MAIASKIRDEEIVVVDELQFDAPTTKEMARVLQSLGLGQTSTLIATAEHDVNVYKSARNISRVTISPVSDLNALSVLAPQRMLVTRQALDAIRERAARNRPTETQQA
jgi:large subunit ribosomal protein L4